MTDEQVLIEASQADHTRFAELYELNFERVYAYIARRVRDRAEAEDLTSEVFHQALANLDRYEYRGIPFAAWLFRIAANAIADRSKRLAREPAVVSAGSSDKTDLEEAQYAANIFRLVRDLPTGQRRVLELRFVEQKSIREIANQLQRTEGAVKQLQFRALENLRARLGINAQAAIRAGESVVRKDQDHG